jgi:hypothetical protein
VGHLELIRLGEERGGHECRDRVCADEVLGMVDRAGVASDASLEESKRKGKEGEPLYLRSRPHSLEN